MPKLIKNEIIVQLLDSFQNPVLSQQSRLKLEIVSRNNSEFSSWMFVDNNDGSYTVHYLAKDVGTYEICASFNGKSFSPCPFGVNVYSSKINILLKTFQNRIIHVYIRFMTWWFLGYINVKWEFCFPDIILNHLQLCGLTYKYVNNRVFYVKIDFPMSSGEYFPLAYSDTISVWEDESIAFDALANDNFAGDNASIAEYTKVR